VPPLPRGVCPVCGHDVALRKNGLVREHWVREQVMGDGEVRVVVANPFSGEVCAGSGEPPAKRRGRAGGEKEDCPVNPSRRPGRASLQQPAGGVRPLRPLEP